MALCVYHELLCTVSLIGRGGAVFVENSTNIKLYDKSVMLFCMNMPHFIRNS
jgi:hypothetical protein